MKRNILLALVAVLAISLIATSAVFAQGNGPGRQGSGTGISVNLEVTLSDYMVPAMADILGMDEGVLSAKLDSGETFITIALSMGYTSEQLPDLMASVRAAAIDLAIADGMLSTEQASFLLSNQYGGNTRGNGAGTASMYSTGSTDGTGTGICLNDGTCVPQSNNFSASGSAGRYGGRP